MSTDIDVILNKRVGAGRDALIPVLQEVQDAQGYLSKESVTKIGETLGLPAILQPYLLSFG